MEPKKKGMTLVAKQKAAGWAFLIPASAMIAIMSFFPDGKGYLFFPYRLVRTEYASFRIFKLCAYVPG